MNWERIEEFSCLHPMYSQEGLNPDPPIPLLPVSGTENLYGMCCHAQLSRRVRGGITALGRCSFLQPSSFLSILLPSSSQTRAPTWHISAPLFLCLPEGRNSRLGGEPELLVPCYIRVTPVYFHTCLTYGSAHGFPSRSANGSAGPSARRGRGQYCLPYRLGLSLLPSKWHRSQAILAQIIAPIFPHKHTNLSNLSILVLETSANTCRLPQTVQGSNRVRRKVCIESQKTNGFDKETGTHIREQEQLVTGENGFSGRVGTEQANRKHSQNRGYCEEGLMEHRCADKTQVNWMCMTLN